MIKHTNKTNVSSEEFRLIIYEHALVLFNSIPELLLNLYYNFFWFQPTHFTCFQYKSDISADFLVYISKEIIVFSR